ncbi:MAG: hypothetical protein ACXWQ5_23200, partial [Ktedonobacterales bacterium]
MSWLWRGDAISCGKLPHLRAKSLALHRYLRDATRYILHLYGIVRHEFSRAHFSASPDQPSPFTRNDT